MGASAAFGKGDAAVSEQDNKAVIHRFYQEVWNKGDLALADELIAPAFVNHGSGSGEGSDRESFKRTISKVRAHLHFRHTVEELIAEGDTVVARLTGRGEIHDEAQDTGPTAHDERFTGTGIVIWKLRNGQITERWACWGSA